MDVQTLSQKLDKICRICLSDCHETEYKSIFSELESSETVDEQIFFVFEIISAAGCLKVKEGDGYPPLICTSCFQDAVMAYKFKIKCQRSESLLKECLELKVLITEKSNNSRQEKCNTKLENLLETPRKAGNSSRVGNQKRLKNNLKIDSELLDVCEFETEASNLECILTTGLVSKATSSVKTDSPKIKEVVIETGNKEEEIPKKCSECNHVFKSISTYDKHACVVAKIEGRKLCPICGKTLSHSYFRSHLRTHTTQRSYVCKICDKIYNSSCSLKFHLYKHSGEKPYLCSLCGKRFIQPTALKYHMRFHNNDRRYSCSYCEKTFVIQSHKVAHERTHTGTKPFTCEICGKSFTRKVEFNLHLNRHNDNMPFSCRYCEKRFIKRTHLNLHEMIHTGKRPHECKFCGKGFIQRSPMLHHIKRRHSDQNVE